MPTPPNETIELRAQQVDRTLERTCEKLRFFTVALEFGT
jgi:hypothetical protein